MPIARDPDRAVIDVTGADAQTFLQGLVTNDVGAVAPGRAVYAALLTPQGKFLFDFFIHPGGADAGGYLLDTAADRAEALLKRLSLYRLRAAVALTRRDDLAAACAWDDATPPPETLAAAPDPRDPALGLRLVVPSAAAAADAEALARLDRRRIALGVPKAGTELIPEATFPLEAGFERACGVDFRKGCFVGQEIVARMKHKATLKKRLVRVRLDGPAPPTGAEITAGGRPAGVMGGAAGDLGLAVLRVDRIDDGALSCGETVLTPLADAEIA